MTPKHLSRDGEIKQSRTKATNSETRISSWLRNVRQGGTSFLKRAVVAAVFSLLPMAVASLNPTYLSAQTSEARELAVITGAT